jgi:hypothetical protein
LWRTCETRVGVVLVPKEVTIQLVPALLKERVGSYIQSQTSSCLIYEDRVKSAEISCAAIGICVSLCARKSVIVLI